jgi:uncharacterized protein YbjQ (UPF0145 family)
MSSMLRFRRMTEVALGWKNELTAVERLDLGTSHEELQQQERLSQIIVSTGDIGEPYEHIDCVFAMGSHSGTAGNIAAVQPTTAFVRVKDLLRAEALKCKANAVIHVQFQYRVSLESSLIGSMVNTAIPGTMSSTNQVFEVFAYGTAVRRTTSASTTTASPPPEPQPPSPRQRLNPGKILIDAGLPQYIKLFAENAIGHDALLTMDTLRIMKLGVKEPDHCARIVSAIQKTLRE